MKTIILSPHFDDAVFSCGGWIWDQTDQGQDVEIWTICAADPPQKDLTKLAEELHQNWRLDADAVRARREEDKEACQLLGAGLKHLHYLDCIYRRSPQGDPYYTGEEDLFGGLDPQESDLVDDLSDNLKKLLPQDATIIAPLGIGNHVDHELTRKAASRLDREMLYYADLPYVRQEQGKTILHFLEGSPDWEGLNFQISQEGMSAWLQSALQYSSQLSTFWPDQAALKGEIDAFAASGSGFKLWKAVKD